MDQFSKQEKNIEVIAFKTKDKVTVNVHGKPSFDMWAKKMIELYNSKQNKTAS
ncbi:hypothetical protein [Peribacillus sp. YIM B13482]|uniref:hypothetical protein n=1 Tax=Peribacillus sp. YIM B13482 TaxID=3366298 RepID=UPI00366E22B6